jgi:hypothetical protein
MYRRDRQKMITGAAFHLRDISAAPFRLRLVALASPGLVSAGAYPEPTSELVQYLPCLRPCPAPRQGEIHYMELVHFPRPSQGHGTLPWQLAMS